MIIEPPYTEYEYYLAFEMLNEGVNSMDVMRILKIGYDKIISLRRDYKAGRQPLSIFTTTKLTGTTTIPENWYLRPAPVQMADKIRL